MKPNLTSISDEELIDAAIKLGAAIETGPTAYERQAAYFEELLRRISNRQSNKREMVIPSTGRACPCPTSAP
jgi:hypothetical protein